MAAGPWSPVHREEVWFSILFLTVVAEMGGFPYHLRLLQTEYFFPGLLFRFAAQGLRGYVGEESISGP